MMVKLNRIIEAPRPAVPRKLRGEIVEKLDEAEQHPDALGAETEDFDDDEDAYDPLKFAEKDDELYPPRRIRHATAELSAARWPTPRSRRRDW